MGWLDQLPHGHFSPNEGALHDPHGDLIDVRLMQLLDEARDEAGVPFRATSGFRSPGSNAAARGATDSAHLKGLAVDGYFEGWPLLEQFVHVLRYPFFGVGLYPHEHVIHVDRKERGKPYQTKALWIRNAAGVYVYAPSAEFWAELRALERTQ